MDIAQFGNIVESSKAASGGRAVQRTIDILMGKSKGLDKEDNDQIGFVIAALFCSALSLDELHKWCFELISAKNPAELPSYIFDLADFKGTPAEVFNTIGFAPVWKHTADDRAALFGIAVKRKRERYEWPVHPDLALKRLAQNPAIEHRFRETFPFVEY